MYCSAKILKRTGAYCVCYETRIRKLNTRLADGNNCVKTNKNRMYARGSAREAIGAHGQADKRTANTARASGVLCL